MQITESNRRLNAQEILNARRLLFVGPKPPPIGGSPLTVQAMLEELALYPFIKVTLINTSPATDARKKMTGFNFEKIRRSLLLLPKYFFEVPKCDVILVFANDMFAITLMPLLLFYAKLFHKPFYLKPVGAGLDLYINAQKKLFRDYLLIVLRATDGILTQTKLLKDDLKELGCTNAHYLPGCRQLPVISPVLKQTSNELRIIFLGHITRLKGPLILLDALKIVSKTCDEQVICDFYGPIHDELHDEFVRELMSNTNAHYCGVAEPGTGSQLIAQYDVLVLPTYFETEGHPGVLIEAMHASVPVITTQIRTIPELVSDGVNGLIVSTQNSHMLAKAITRMTQDPIQREKMGQANYIKGKEFRAEKVVAQLLGIIFPDLSI